MMKKEQIHTLSDFDFPASTQMELQVIADLVSSAEMMQDAQRIVRAEMFTDTQCRRAWDTLCEMEDKHQPIDLISVQSAIDADFFINKLIPATSSSGGTISVIHHCNILATIAIRQRAYQFAVRMLQEATNKAAPLEDLIALPEEFASAVRSDLNADADSVAVSQVMNEVADNIQQEQEERARGRTTRVPTGFPTLDSLCYGGFGPGQLIIVAARPSVGKTAIALAMARAAASAGVPATLFSLEMTRAELGQRLLLSTGIVKPRQLIQGQAEWTDFERAAGQFDKWPLYLNDSSRTLEEITARIILNAQHKKGRIAFVDYLGLIDTRTEASKPLYQIIAGITKRLKQVAKDCRIPIVLLCQLNRASASDNRPPELYDLRDSGSIEQDADIVLMLERPSTFADTSTSEDAWLRMWVRKNRQGKAGNIYIDLRPNDSYTQFQDCGLMQG